MKISEWYRWNIKPYVMLTLNIFVASLVGGVVGGLIIIYYLWIWN